MGLKENFWKIKYNLKRYGPFFTLKKILKRIFRIGRNRKSDIDIYREWIEENEKDIKSTEYFSYNPKISIVVPMYNTKEIFFKELIESLKNQTYSNWELCLADGSETENRELKKYFFDDERIKYKYLEKNSGISGNTNEAINMVTGEYIGFLDHDDTLACNALYEVVKVLNKNKKIDFIYTDEDKIDQNGERFEPHFKPDFSPETLESTNYITHLVIVSKSLQEKIGLLDFRFNGAQDYDFVLRAMENTENIAHISKILYHWRVHRDSTANVADTKPYAYKAGVRAIEAHLLRTGKKGTVEYGNDIPGIYKIKYEIIGNPKVSIIIPNKDNIKILKQCINSIIKLTTYSNYEIVIIENNSEKDETFSYYKSLSKNPKIKVLNYKMKNREFNYSKLINFGVKNVDGDFVLQLNNDTKVITKDWLELFIGYAQNKEIGAVGARLYYSDKSIQHAGITVGISGIAGNNLVNLPYGSHGYFGQDALTKNVSAVTGACLFARREVYEKVGYMNEDEFKVAFNDVDFCLKLIRNGYRVVYNPYVELFHYESKTRGYELTEKQMKRFDEECKNFNIKWKEYIDPYYNCNFSLKTCNYDLNIKEEIMEKSKKKLSLRIFEFFENIGLKILEIIYLKKIADFYRKHIEGMRYLICGALATVVNILVYYICYYPLKISNGISNVIAWVIAALFAYITNRSIVFNSQVNTKKGLLKEIVSFFGCRLLTLGIDEAIMVFTVDNLGWNGLLMKVIANIIVIILNFIFSKILIFKKKD